MAKAAKTRIDANGNLLPVGGGGGSSASEDSPVVSSSDSLLCPSSVLRSTASRTVDFFGFNLELKQLLTALAVASLMLGTQGTAILLGLWGAYAIFSRIIPRTSSSSSSSVASSRRGGGGGGWGGPSGGGGGGGSNIRGISDLPSDPVRG